MKRMLAGLICGVALTGLTLGTAAASGDGDDYYEGRYEGGEAYEHGRAYSNPSVYTNYGYTNYSYPVNGYSNHEAREYNAGYSGESYEYGNRYNTGIVYPNANVYGNVGYRNHEMYEYGR